MTVHPSPRRPLFALRRARSATAASRRSGGEVLGCRPVGVLTMVLSDRSGGVLEMRRGFPGAFVRSVAKPMYEVFDLPMSNPRVQDALDFPFHIIVDFHRGRRRLNTARELVLAVRLQERHVKHRMDAHLSRQLQPEGQFALSDGLQDLEGTEALDVEFRGGARR